MSSDPPAFEVLNELGSARAVLFCEHAGRAIPESDCSLGLDQAQLSRHIAWDIGAADLTRGLSEVVDAPAIFANYSRLFIDPNRAVDNPASILSLSDGVSIPGNQAVDRDEATRRARVSFWPYHRRAEKLIADVESRLGRVATIGIHSFTPVMNGFERPWQIGILWNEDDRIAAPMMDELRKVSGLNIGDNKPYSGIDPPGYSFLTYGAKPGRPNVVIEVRQDLIGTVEGAAEWAAIIGPVIKTLLADSALFLPFQK